MLIHTLSQILHIYQPEAWLREHYPDNSAISTRDSNHTSKQRLDALHKQASQSIHSIHSKVEWNGLTLGRSILPVEWIHPIQNGWIDDGLIHVDSAHVKSYLSSAFDFCCPSGAEIR